MKERIAKFLSKNFNIALLLELAVIAAAVFLFGYRCPFEAVFGIDCPGCGLTRALLAALRLDFAGSFSYHPLLILVIAWIVYLLFFQRTKPLPRKWELIALCVTVVLFLALWVCRVFLFGNGLAS